MTSFSRAPSAHARHTGTLADEHKTPWRCWDIAGIWMLLTPLDASWLPVASTLKKTGCYADIPGMRALSSPSLLKFCEIRADPRWTRLKINSDEVIPAITKTLRIS